MGERDAQRFDFAFAINFLFPTGQQQADDAEKVVKSCLTG